MENTRKSRKHLLHSIIRACNAFYKSLENDGYHTEGNHEDMLIIDNDASPVGFSAQVGRITIKWKINIEED